MERNGDIGDFFCTTTQSDYRDCSADAKAQRRMVRLLQVDRKATNTDSLQSSRAVRLLSKLTDKKLTDRAKKNFLFHLNITLFLHPSCATFLFIYKSLHQKKMYPRKFGASLGRKLNLLDLHE